jgi:DNA-binding Xre family transcriptional regulator
MLEMLYLCDYYLEMIRFKFQELLIAKGYREGRRVTLDEVAAATGIHRTTLSRLSSPRGANVTSDNLDRLCHYFQCELSELAVYETSDLPEPRKKPQRSNEKPSDEG